MCGLLLINNSQIYDRLTTVMSVVLFKLTHLLPGAVCSFATEVPRARLVHGTAVDVRPSAAPIAL